MQYIRKKMEQHRDALLNAWQKTLVEGDTFSDNLLDPDDLQTRCAQFYEAMAQALAASTDGSLEKKTWEPVRAQLVGMIESWVRLGFSPSDVVSFVISLKTVIIAHMLDEGDTDKKLAIHIKEAGRIFDAISVWAAESFEEREAELKRRQQAELLELSTPVISIWDRILVLPLIGTLDSSRTQLVMENLLAEIVEERAEVAILDITGVPTVDTMVAQHLIKTVTAARLMGAACIISGIRPSIAQTMVQLGVDMGEVTTKATLADAFEVALRRRGHYVCPLPAGRRDGDGEGTA